jgi:hypothetical protein
MAAEATFILRAIDSTKEAFAKVQNSLQKLKGESSLVAGAMKKAFDLKGIGMAAIIASGLSLSNVIEKVTQTLVDAITRFSDVRRVMKETAIEVAEIYKKTYFQLMTDEDKYASLQKDRAVIQEKINALAIKEKVIRQVATGGMGGVKMAMAETTDLTKEEAEALKELRKQLAGVDSDMTNLLVAADNRSFQENMAAQVVAAQKSAEAFTNQQERVNASQVAVQKLGDTMNNVSNSVAKLTVEQIAHGESLKASVMTPLEKFVSESQRLSLILQAEIIDQETFNRLIGEAADVFAASEEAQRKFVDSLGSTNDETERLKKSLGELQMINDAGNIIAQGFEDAILSGQKLQEVVKGIARDLLRMVFQQTITAPLAAGISGALKTMVGARAMGGPVSANSPYIVGERGPELFVPHASGSIVSNSNMNQGGGSAGPSINVNYNIAAGVTRNELGPILEQERRRLKAEIPDMVRRGGAYRSAFA